MSALASERKLLNAREVAAALGVSPLTVRRLAADGVLDPVRFQPKSRLRFRRDDIESLIESGAPASSGESTRADTGSAARSSASAAALPTTSTKGAP